MASTRYGFMTGDPKLWPASIRYAVLVNICLFTFMGNMFQAGLATGFPALAAEFHVGFAPLVDLISWPVLAIGVASLFWMPTALCVGKRPVILASMTIFLAGSIWSLRAKTLNSLLAARIFAVFGAGSVESLGPSIFADIFFERRFSTAMAIFSLALSGGAQIGPMIAGYLINSKGWRSFFTLCTIVIAVNLVTCIFFLPETTYRHPIVEGETAAEVDKAITRQVELDELRNTSSTETSPREEKLPVGYWKNLVAFRNRSFEPEGLRRWPQQFSLPFRFLLVPAALFATATFGISLAGLVVISVLAPALFSPPAFIGGYGFSASQIGLYSLSSMIGIVLAFPIAGPLTDLFSRYMSRRNGGVHKPEHRIPALIVPFLISPPGLILWAYMISQHRSIYLSAIGANMQASSLVLVASVVLSYVIDAYPETNGEALVLINAGKNAVAFGVTRGANDWLASEGLEKMFLELAGGMWIVMAFAVPIYIWGPALRRKTGRILR